jgi:polyisoprenoid-binding protein YceI
MPTTTYDLDPTHTTLAFSVRHMMVTQQRGQFRGVRGRLVLDRDDVTRSSVEATIEVASIDTGLKDRDAHLRSADFFDADHHPHITFVSRRIDRVSGDLLRVTGDLTIRGTTRPVVLETEPVSPESKDPFGQIKVGTTATTKISRQDFGLVWNAVLETGGVAVGDEVKLTLDLQFQRQP